MEAENRLSEAIEGLESISVRLNELSNLIETVHMGLKCEKLEKQALDCIICIDHSVKSLFDFTEDTLNEISGKTDKTI